MKSTSIFHVLNSWNDESGISFVANGVTTIELKYHTNMNKINQMTSAREFFLIDLIRNCNFKMLSFVCGFDGNTYA